MSPETVTIPGLPDFVSIARKAARSYFADAGESVREDAELVTSEFATNAVLWSRSGLPGGRFELTFTLDAEAQSGRIEVTTEGPLPKDPGETREDPGELPVHGRGLEIVDRLAKEWGHSGGLDAETYWAVLTW